MHEVEEGDHGLKVHAGKESQSQTQAALQQVTAAVCTFANSVNSTSESKVAKGKMAGDSSATEKLQDNTVLENPKAATKRKASAICQTTSKKGKFAC